jgi:hypothetical protein
MIICLQIGRIPGYCVWYPAGYPTIEPGIRLNTGYKKRPDYSAGYPVHPWFITIEWQILIPFKDNRVTNTGKFFKQL